MLSLGISVLPASRGWGPAESAILWVIAGGHQSMHHATLMSILTLGAGLVVLLLLACFLIRLLAPFLDGLDFPDSDGQDPGSGGGGSDWPPSAPPPPSPSWWPEFEREFAAYLAPRVGPPPNPVTLPSPPESALGRARIASVAHP